MDLFGNSQALPDRRRVDGLTVRKNFTKVIQDKGGDIDCQAMATEALTQEVMGCTAKQLYRKTNAKFSDRETLPDRAQEALMTGEIVATHDLKSREIQGRSQQQINTKIVGSVRDSGKKVRKLFPW